MISSRDLNSIISSKTPLSHKVTFPGSGDWDTDISFGGWEGHSTHYKGHGQKQGDWLDGYCSNPGRR